MPFSIIEQGRSPSEVKANLGLVLKVIHYTICFALADCYLKLASFFEHLPMFSLFRTFFVFMNYIFGCSCLS